MALPGSRGGPATKDQAVELAETYATIFRLRLRHHMTWKQISSAVGYHPKHCAAIYYREKGTAAGRLTIEAHMAEIFGDIAHMWDVYRPWLFPDESAETWDPPPKEVV